MRDEGEYHQAMLERQQMLEEALERAEAGVATEADWNTIRYECGVSRKPNLKLETIGAKYEFDSESR
jgi:hypothetical protein